MAIGKVGSFATDAPLERNYIGQALDTVEQNQFKYRAEKRLADEKKKADDDAKLKELEEYNSKFKVNIVGNQSIDDTTTQYAMRTKQEVGDLTKQIQMTNDFNKKADLMALRAKKVQSFDILKQIPDMLIKQGQEVAKGVEEGKYNPDDVNLIQERFKSLEQGKVHYYTDDAGNLRFTTYKIDESGNPTGIIDKDQSVAELSKSLSPHLKSTYQDVLKNSVDNTAVKETVVQNGFTTTTNKKVEDSVANANAAAFGNLIANQPHEAYALGKRYGIDPSNKEEIAKVASAEFKNALDEQYKKDIDQAGLLANRKFKRDVKKEEDENPVIGTGTITASEGSVEGTNYKVPKNSKTFAISKAQRKLGDGKIQSLKEVRVLPDGKLAFVTEETYETETKTSSRVTPQGEKNIAKFLKDNPDKKEADYVYKFGDAENVNTKNAAPKIKVYDTGKDADDAEGLSIMLINPETGEKFSGLNETIKYFKDKASNVTSGGKKESPAERAKRIANGD